MKALILFLFIFSTAAYANPVFTGDAFVDLTIDQQVEVLQSYKEFLRDASESMEEDKFSSFRFSFFEEAIASGRFDCFFAGWPSVSRPSGSKRLCTSPKNGNPDYKNLASSCGADQLLCQPAIFGDGLCVNVGTRKEKNSAFKQCENKFEESGRTLADVAGALSTQEKRNKLNELVQDSEHICRAGLRTQKTLCERLKNKLLAVKREAEKTQVQDIRRAAETAAVVTSTRPEPQVDCDPNTPGIQTIPPARPTQRVVRSAPQRQPGSGMQRLFCSSQEIAASKVLPQDIPAFMRANNIQVVHGSATTQQLQDFVSEFLRFPEPLREEMRQRNSRINLIVGNGVTEDPSWAVEQRQGRPEDQQDWVNTPDGRRMSTIPGTGGSLGDPRTNTPTRIVVNRLRDEGSVSLFIHEYAHTLDSMYGDHAITKSQKWRNAFASDSQVTNFLNTICAENYCTNSEHPEEAFAELFAYYHACPSTRQQMKEHLPNISQFMEELRNVRAYLGRP